MNKIAKVRRDDFLADGYVVARDILDRSALDTINAEISELFAIQFLILDGTCIRR